MPAGPLYSNRALSMANQVLVVWRLRLGNPPLVRTCSPQTLDAQPVQMQRRITEMVVPLLAAVQQRDTEAQRLQTAGDRNEALHKQAADEQKAESKDCCF